MLQLQRDRRGHEFLPEEQTLNTWPKIGATEEVRAGDKIIHAHYFIGNSDWYVAEFQENGSDEPLAFGWACLAGDLSSAEWGYFNLYELESINIHEMVIERDLYWQVKPAREVLPVEAWQWADRDGS